MNAKVEDSYKTTGHHYSATETPVWSSSLLKTFEMCPSLYLRRYVLGLAPTPRADPNRPRAKDTGHEVHSYIEKVLRGEELPRLWTQDRSKIRRMGENLLGTLEHRVGRVETKFRETVHGVTFSGTVDLDQVPELGQFHDWKTTAGHPYRCPRCDTVLELAGVGMFEPSPPCPSCAHVAEPVWLNEERLALDYQQNIYACHFLRKHKLQQVDAVWHYVETKTTKSDVHKVHITSTRKSVTPVMMKLVALAKEAEALRAAFLQGRDWKLVPKHLQSCNKYGKCEYMNGCVSTWDFIDQWGVQ